VAAFALSLLAWAGGLPRARAAAAAEASPGSLAQAQFLASLRSKIPLQPIGLAADPYLTTGAPAVAAAGTVCGVRFERDQLHYRLGTFASKNAAGIAGYAVTHYSACGTCSTLQDLAVYMERPDLTAPVRECAVRVDDATILSCLKGLGFSTACAQTWLYNVQNTRRQCFSVCMLSWIEGEAPRQADGRLNGCLQCDEDRSGPVFKATAGRTRRNSGIRSSIPRPEEEIAPVVHSYVPGAQQ